MTQCMDTIVSLYARRGQAAYGETVTVNQHSLQCAALARAQGAPNTLVIAALLHDIGHLLEHADDEFGYHRHDEAGGAYLARLFPPPISEPVRLHVAAKRYLCAVEPDYLARLSHPSMHSLQQQGGPMREEEITRFKEEPYYQAAVRLRRWDESGKVDNLAIGQFDDYRPLLNGPY
ncbi:MAG: HD domain-containing protein [Gammaproteobacteria bacterium]|nr:HD domain-containing protein [Gammaproteobacteria bacterium]